MNRITAFLLGLVVLSSWAAPRPNVLFIYTDDQRWDALGVVQREQGDKGRFPWFTTPNMDRLAAEGVRFRNAFVVNSLCAPSRAVNLTGRYSHDNGIASNFRPFPATNVTHASLLRAAGYTTGYIGKWHMDSQRERPGFDHHATFIGHARYVDPPFIVDGVDKAEKGWIDDISTDYAIQFIRKQKGAEKPWSLVVGFKSPHGPFDPPARAKERFAGEVARVTPNFDAPAPYNGKAGVRARTETKTVPAPLDYLRCISAVDDCLGRLLAALDETGCASNTVVIYTSDNGFYLGEHGLGDKRSAYDESLRVPFLVRHPLLGYAARGRLADQMVLNLDLAPSLLELAGEKPTAEMLGRSWVPLLTGPAATWRTAWFYEYFAERQKNSRVPDITAVRTADAKLIRYVGHDEWSELFDLANDPYETKNLHADPNHAALRTRLVAELESLKQSTGYRVPDYVDRPDWWDKPGGADWQADGPVGLRLHFDFRKGADGTIKDASGNGNVGALKKVSFVEGRGGSKALRFDGAGHVEVAKTPGQNPAGGAWSVVVALKADQPDGVILARGGELNGYGLHLKDGRPVFTVHADGKATQIVGAEAITGRWTQLDARIGADRKLVLHVDGVVVAKGKIPAFIPEDPNDSLQIGADTGSPIIGKDVPPFTGLIESVHLYRGEPVPAVKP